MSDAKKKITTCKRKVVDERAEELETKYLAASEIEIMNINSEKETSRQLSLKVQELKIENVKLQIKALENGLKVEQLNMRQVNQQVATERAAHKKFVEGLREKYDLPSAWGFDPFTGEIK